MNIYPYGKNQLYTALYKVKKTGEVDLPDGCYWKVLKYLGNSKFSPVTYQLRGEIALVLHDKESKFLPLISFLTKEEAKKLKKELEKALESD